LLREGIEDGPRTKASAEEIVVADVTVEGSPQKRRRHRSENRVAHALRDVSSVLRHSVAGADLFPCSRTLIRVKAADQSCAVAIWHKAELRKLQISKQAKYGRRLNSPKARPFRR
jgi:hypothetical protein